jgi:hypothetical protein
LAGETEVLGENVPQRHFVDHKAHMTRPGFEPGPPRWAASDYPHGTAFEQTVNSERCVSGIYMYIYICIYTVYIYFRILRKKTGHSVIIYTVVL